MCRWFAYIAPEEQCILEDVLITPVSDPWKQLRVGLTDVAGTRPFQTSP